jgi:hypothetical protein
MLPASMYLDDSWWGGEFTTSSAHFVPRILIMLCHSTLEVPRSLKGDTMLALLLAISGLGRSDRSSSESVSVVTVSADSETPSYPILESGLRTNE